MRWSLWLIAVVLFMPHWVFGYSYLESSCDGTEITITLAVFNDISQEAEGLEILVKQEMVGICGPEVTLDAPPMFLPAYATGYEVTFSVQAPIPDLFYAFNAYYVLPDGSHFPLYFASHEAGCGLAIAARGLLVEGTEGITYSPCPDDCWTGVVYEGGLLGFYMLAPEQYEAFVGTNIPVDLYGIPGSPYPMPGDFQLVVTQIQPSTLGSCGPVPSETINWGSMKARYRGRD